MDGKDNETTQKNAKFKKPLLSG